MSRQPGRRRRPSELDAEYEARNLVRTGVAAQMLHIDAEVLAVRISDGVIERHRFEAGNGHLYNGIARAEVERIHQVMWPACAQVDCAIRSPGGPS